MKFRKKPVVVEAMLFDGTEENFNQIWAWACPSDDTLESPVHCGNHDDGSDDYTELSVRTWEGDVTAHPGEWIIKGTRGEFYPCKPEAFADSYEPA
jgi:hypothetical protein